jgi:zinc protease
MKPTLQPTPQRQLAALAFIAAAGLASASWAQAPAPPPADAGAKTTPPPGRIVTPSGLRLMHEVEGIQEYQLPNGMQLLLVPDDSKSTTTVNLTLRVGSRHESYGETGMAHLLEHLIFKGTPTTKNVWAEFAKRGFRANGTTWVDRTNYFASFTANDDNLRWYVGWLADALVNSFIARADLDTEMTVVRNEMEAGENDPGRILFQRTLSSMYEWHNYGKDTIGARTDVEKVDIANLQAFYRKHYQPDNATLIVSGRFDPTMVHELAAKTFGAIPKPQRTLTPTYTLDPAQDGERTVTVRRIGGTPLIHMAYHMPPGAHPDFAAASLLAQVLGDVPAGRLHKRLVETKLAAGVYTWPAGFAEPGLLLTGAQLGAGQSIERARAAMAAVLDGLGREPGVSPKVGTAKGAARSLAAEPVTAAELVRARRQWLNAWERDFTDPQKIGVEISEAIAQGDWRLYFLKRDQVRKVTLADINRVAAQRLRVDNRTVAIYEPVAKPERAPAPANVDVAALVKDYKGDPNVVTAEAFEATPANLERRTQRSELASGMRVALLPKGTRGRAVQARLALHLGDEKSLRGTDTVASLVGANLTMGAAGLTRQQISDAWDQLRAQVAFAADDQTVTVDIQTVREHLPTVVALVGKLLRQPTFPPESMGETQRQALAAIEAQRKEPQAVVANAVQRHGNPYPKGDLRYAPTFDEMMQDLTSAKRAQLRDFHRRFYSAAKAEFSAVGDHDPVAVKQALEKAFGDWRAPAAGPQPYVRVPTPPVNVAPQRLMLATPDKQNANLHAQLTVPVSDEDADYVPLMVGNFILGGSTNSRLWARVREKEGLSYDVRSTIAWNPFEGNSTWVSTAIFAPQNQPKVEAAWRDELDKSVKQGFTQAELDEARNGLLNRRRLSRAQDEETSSTLRAQLHLRRTYALAQKIDEQLGALTLEQVNAAWKRHFDPNKLVVGWAGDFKAP